MSYTVIGDYMDLKKGDKVTRKSHNNDMIFIITEINEEEGICYLNGVNIRLIADSPLGDLEFFEDGEDIEGEGPFLERIKPDMLDRNDYFYLPGKILHIDGDNRLCNKILMR